MSSSPKSENLINTIDFAKEKISEQLIIGIKPFSRDLKRPAVKNQLLNSPEILALIAEATAAAESAAAAEELVKPLTQASTSSEARVQKSNMKTKAVDAGKAIIDPARLTQIVTDFLASSNPPPPPLSASSSSASSPPPPPTSTAVSSSPASPPPFPPAGSSLSISLPPVSSSSSSLVSPVSVAALPLSPLPPPVNIIDLVNVEKEPVSTRPNIILLNTNEMAFFCYNLFSHDISHDAHPSGLGTKRFNDAILLADESQSNVMSESSLYSGGGKINQRGGYTSISSGEIDDSINSIINSIGSELMENNMLYALQTNRNMDSFKQWENQKFIIININDIIENYHYGDEHSMYPGYIYFNNKTINPYDINVERTGTAKGFEPSFKIEFDSVEITFSFRRVDPIINNIYINGETYIKMTKKGGRDTQSFNTALTALGAKFFYGIFTDYMENKSSSKIEGYGSLFPNYYEKRIIVGEGYNPQSFTRFCNIINVENYLLYYDYVLDIYIGFIARLPIDKNTQDKIMIYVTTDTEEGNEDEAEEIRNHKNEFINYLAIIFANQYETQVENDYTKFQTALKNFTDQQIERPEVKELSDFLTIVNFYFSKEYVSRFLGEEFIGDVTPEAGGGSLQKKKLQFGGALTFMKKLFNGIDDFTNPIDFKDFTKDSQDYSPEYKSEIYPSGAALVPSKILSFIVNSPIPYDLSNFETLALPYREEIFDMTKKNIIRMSNLIDILLTEFSNPDKKKTGPNPNPKISNITSQFSDPKAKNFPIEALILQDTHLVEIHLAAETDFIKYVKSLKEFEQNIFRQIKIAIYYLKTKDGPLPNNPPNKTIFFENLLKNLNTYKEVIEIIGHIIEAKPKLSQAQKINGSYMIASAVLSMSHYMKQMSNVHPENSTILTSEINMLSDIFLKKNLLKGTAGSNIDDKLINNFVTWLTPGTLNGAGSFVTNTKFLYNEDDLPANKTLWKSTKIKAPTGNKLQYISNAVSATDVGLPKFLCPFSSIVDGQSTCNSYESSIRTGHAVEIGLLNVIVRDGNPVIGTSTTTNESMRYHVRVEKHEDPTKWDVASKESPKTIKISAYLKIGNEVIINIGKVGEYIKTINKPYIEVDLNSSSSPLEAAACIKTIMDICINTLRAPDGTYRKWDDYLNFLNKKNDTMIVPIPNNPGSTMTKSSRELRNEILSASFVKSLGDYLQELNIVAENGGYVGSITSDPTKQLAAPSEGRFGFSNDRPSGVRLVLLLLFGKTGINNKSFGGYLTEKGHYLIGVRNKNDSMTAGGNKNVKRKTKRRRNKNQTKKKYDRKNKRTKKYKKITRKYKRILKRK